MSSDYTPQLLAKPRRTDGLNIKIKSPQLNLIVGTTPSNLLHYLPEVAWEQGFCSRFIMVFSDERTIGDDFADVDTSLNLDLIHDLKSISGLVGQFKVTTQFKDAVNI